MTGSDTLIDGRPSDCIDPRDRGLQYGDGLFETLAVTDGQVEHWGAHWKRLYAGCERLQMPPPEEQAVLDDIGRLVPGAGRSLVKVIVTRGAQGRGYRPLPIQQPTRIVSRHDWPDHPPHYRTDGVRATLCATRLAIQPQLAGIKHLNRLEQVLARAEWGDEFQEGVMRDTRGNVVSGTMSNLFLVNDDGLVTPDLNDCGIAGTMRARVLDWADDEGIPVHVRTVTLDEVTSAGGLFFTNAIIGVWPVAQLDSQAYDTPEITKRLLRRIGE